MCVGGGGVAGGCLGCVAIITYVRTMRKKHIYDKVALIKIFCFFTIGAALKGKNLLPLCHFASMLFFFFQNLRYIRIGYHSRIHEQTATIWICCRDAQADLGLCYPHTQKEPFCHYMALKLVIQTGGVHKYCLPLSCLGSFMYAIDYSVRFVSCIPNTNKTLIYVSLKY